MRSKIVERIERACCYITVFSGDELVSEGTGFAYTDTGEVLTAAHVVTGKWPIRHADYKDPDQIIYCKFPGVPPAEYRVFFCSIDIQVEAFTGPVQIDISVLLPKEKFSFPVAFLPASVIPPCLGEDVLMAGFSEEVELPFNVDRILQEDYPGAEKFRDAMRIGYMADMSGPLMKSGMVGNVRRVMAENSHTGDKLECDVMYIDNAMHPGASGGPVVNGDGVAVGVVSQRAVTRVDVGEKRVSVPSGCTVALSLGPLTYIAKKNGHGTV